MRWRWGGGGMLWNIEYDDMYNSSNNYNNNDNNSNSIILLCYDYIYLHICIHIIYIFFFFVMKRFVLYTSKLLDF